MRRLGLLLLVALAAVGSAWIWHQAQTSALSPMPVRPLPLGAQPLAPDFVLETLDGRELALASLRGRPVVLNFWASWCVPCRLEMQILSDAARRYRGRVHFLGVNVLDRPDEARRFVKRLEVPFPSVLDEDGAVLERYRVVGIPTTVFITRSGRLFEVHAGPFVGPEGAHRLEHYLTRLLQQP